MSFFKKLFSVGKNTVVEAVETKLDSMVDIKREGNVIIKDIDSKVNTLKKRIEESQTTVCSNKNEMVDLEAKIRALNEVAKRAVVDRNDDDAVQALNRVELHQLTLDSLQASNDILEPIIKQQVQYIHTLKAERNSLSAEIQRMDIEEKAYKLKAEMLGGNSGTFAYNIDDLRDRVKKAKASVEAKEIINNEFNDIVETKEVVKLSVQDKLDNLKKDVFGS